MFQIVRDRGKRRDLRREPSSGSATVQFPPGPTRSANLRILGSQGYMRAYTHHSMAVLQSRLRRG
jgi:hypothetical protein